MDIYFDAKGTAPEMDCFTSLLHQNSGSSVFIPRLKMDQKVSFRHVSPYFVQLLQPEPINILFLPQKSFFCEPTNSVWLTMILIGSGVCCCLFVVRSFN
jgi:hypothetical protein